MSDASVDVDAMAMLARNGSSALKVRARNGSVRFHMRRDNRRALAEATKAVEAVRKTGDRALEATSVSLLAEAQARIGKLDDALSMSLRAIKLFEALGDGVGLGHARWVNGLVHLMAGRVDEAREPVSAALESARAAGDFYGIGNALNMLMQFDADHANAMRLGQEAIDAFERAGDVNQRAMMVGNVANFFERLGLYRRARRMQQEVVTVARSSDLRGLLAYALGNQIGCEIKLHEVDAARALLGDFRLQVAGLADAKLESGVEMYTAQVELLTGDCRAAARRLRKSLELAHGTNLGQKAVIHSMMGTVAIAAGDAKAALRATTKATSLHRRQNFAPTEDCTVQEIWWTHARALAANGQKDKARAALERAHAMLLEGIASVRDEGLRRSYLNKDATNRAIVAAWVDDATARKLPRERILAHLAIESNVREPFRRLADTGLRLNTLRTVEDIRRFIVEEATELSGGERVLLVLERSGQRELSDALVPHGEDAQKLLRAIEPYLAHAASTRAAKLSYTPARATPLRQRSRIVAPLIVQGRVLGYLYVDMDGLFGRFDDTDRDMLELLASQAAVALDNAQWSMDLEQKVAQRTTELAASNALLEQRANELAIINSVQSGLASQLDIQAIFDLVGDKVRDTFNAQAVAILTLDRNGVASFPYIIEAGVRQYEPTSPLGEGGFSAYVVKTRKPLLINEQLLERAAEVGSTPVGGGEVTRSGIWVPLIVGDEARGVISIQNIDREHAFSDADFRLL
ncbi:MAG TPA: GAF domain-containing protein, partial [Casimicrobiaceae bacterium]|nr:GAF domain-containing protein [Casimicrobiaceae bacterium]